MNYIFEIVMLFSMSTSNQGDTAGDLLPGKPLQTCSNLFKLVQTCPNLSKPVQTCPNLFGLVWIVDT
jgi:hypothetical protein